MLRGIERRRIFHDDRDRRDLLDRLSLILPEADMRCFAWALMPNHVHLVVRTGTVPLARVMARVNTGYALAFNQRHERVGYLFQGRYRSFLVAEESYLLTLVRYVHLNPLRSGTVRSLSALGRHRWTGHATLMGRSHTCFQDTRAILERFGGSTAEGRRRLLEWMRSELVSERDASGAASHAAKRVPGKGESQVENRPVDDWARAQGAPREECEASMPELIEQVCAQRNVSVKEVLTTSIRRRSVADARAEIAHRACTELGLAGSAVARGLGLSKGAVSQARIRGRALLASEPRQSDP